MRKGELEKLVAEAKRPADSRDVLLTSEAISGELRPAIARCQWCGREAAEGWTPERAPDDQLCARCLQMVRDPDVWRE